MEKAPKPLDISNLPELLRIAQAVRDTNEPRGLILATTGGTGHALLAYRCFLYLPKSSCLRSSHTLWSRWPIVHHDVRRVPPKAFPRIEGHELRVAEEAYCV
jgi:hypothetical protein